MKVRRLLPLLLVPLAACMKSDPMARGEATFSAFGCVRCHSIGHAGGAYGPDLTTIGFRKTSEWLDIWLKNPHQWREKTVMPNFHLTDGLRADLVAYLSAQKGQAWRGTRPWDAAELQSDPVKKGEVLFSKAGCVACHSLRGAGGYPNNNVVGGEIPPLNKVIEGFSKEELKTRISNGRKSDPADPSATPPMLFMPPWKEVLNERDIDAVIEYLFSLGPKKGGSEW